SSLVDTVLDEIARAAAHGQSLTLRGLSFTPYEQPRDLAAESMAAAEAEQERPLQPDEPIDLRVLPTMPEPELQAEPATLAYSSGDADTDETIGDLTAQRS